VFQLFEWQIDFQDKAHIVLVTDPLFLPRGLWSLLTDRFQL
jgi:hypothetical protein